MREHRLPAQTPLVAVTLLAAVIRLPTLAQQSFWLDEAYTVRLMRMGFGQMLRTVPKTESTPPLYYACAWLWTHVFTSSEYGLRSLSALAGIATVPVVALAARRLAGERAGLIAGLLIAVSPLMVWFSQEARAYAWAALLGAGTVLCMLTYLQDGRSRALLGWAACAALGLATHYFVAFLVAPEVVVLVARRRPHSTAALSAAVGIVAAVAIALVPLALAQRGTGHADYIAQGALSTRVAQVPKQLLLGYASPAQTVTSVLAAVLVLAAATAALLAGRDALRPAVVPLLLGVCTVLVPIVLAVIGIDFLNTRNLIVALPPLAVAAAVGLAGARAGAWCAAALALLCVVVVGLVDGNVHYQRSDSRGVSRALGSAPGPRALVVGSASAEISLFPYRSGLSLLTAPAPVSELDVIVGAAQSPGHGLAAPPPAAPAPPTPPGFTALKPDRTATFIVWRYRAPSPRVVTPTAAIAEHPAPGAAVLYER